ncbi:MAG: TonB-dependent receptor, partial [Colwellia sp.]|nr:TonB-dependent receptor [Colwellia sp.]
MKNKCFSLSFIVLTNLATIQFVHATPDEPADLLNLSLEDLLNTKVITSSKYLEKSVDSPANIHVITAKQINDRGYKNIADLLKNLPGVDIQEFSIIGNYNVVTLRGAKNNNKFIILRDGIRISTPAGEINAISENYPLYLAKRVEVLIGPAAVSYGADAFSGVINIITFDAQDKDHSNITISVGDSNYLNGSILYSNLFDNGIYINLGLQGYYSQDFDFTDDYPELYGDSSQNYDFKNTNEYQFFADAKMNKHFSVGVFHSKITYSSDFTAKPSFSTFQQSFMEESSTTIYANFDYDLTSALHAKTLFTYQLFTLGNGSNFNNLFTSFTKQYKYGRTARYSLNQDFTYQFNQAHLLSGGLVYDYFDIIPRSPNLPAPYEVEEKPDEQSLFYPNTELPITFFQQRDENIGIYIQDNWQINEQWRQVSGIRYDHHTLYGDTINPRLTTIYQANEYNIFKIMYAHSFLAPPPNLAFNSFGSFTGQQNEQGEWLSSPFAPFRVPNAELKPETLKSLELNYEHWFNSSSKIKFAPFYNHIDNVILITNDAIAKQAIDGAFLNKTNSFKNVGESATYGIDISTNLNFVYENSTVDYWLALSYIEGELTEQAIDTDLPMIAHYKVKTGLSYSYQNKYIISPTVRWISETTGNNLIAGSQNQRTTIDSYFIIDLHSEAQVTEQLSFKIT